jgi:hypothetical protein
MSYEIELTIGDGSHTFHYGSLEAYRKDIAERRQRVQRLHINALRDGITNQRKKALLNMLAKESNLIVALDKAAAEELRKLYA